MFEGEIICRSQFGVGSNFIFIVALADSTDLCATEGSIRRITNPILIEY